MVWVIIFGRSGGKTTKETRGTSKFGKIASRAEDG
jgi:hypothetical protein